MSFTQVAALVLLVAACSGSDSTQTEADPAGGEQSSTSAEAMSLAASSGAEAGACELPSGGYAEACNSCLAERCCAPVDACKADAECADQLRCIVECQSAESPTECSVACTTGSGVHAGYVAYDDCSFSECLDQCWM